MGNSRRFLVVNVLLSIGLTLACLDAGRTFAQSANDVKTVGAGTKKMAEGLKELVTKRQDQLKKLQKAAKKSGNTKDVLAYADSLQKLGKVGKALGAMGAGLGMGMELADALGLFGPSAEEQMLDALKEISGKIDDLQEVMLDRLDDLEEDIKKEIKLESAKAQIRPSLLELSTTQKEVEIYMKLVNAENPNYEQIDKMENDLATRKSHQIFMAANGVCEQMLGKNQASDLMSAHFTMSYGDISHGTEVATNLLRMVQNAQFNFELIETMKERRGNEDDLKKQFPSAEARVKYRGQVTYERYLAISDNSQERFGPLLEQIGSALTSYVLRAVRERESQVIKYMESKYGGEANRKGPLIKETLAEVRAQRLQTAKQSALGFKKVLDKPEATYDLEKKYGTLADDLKRMYGCDWLVVAYHPALTFNDNGTDYKFWTWYGSNLIWFYEKEHEGNFAIPTNRRTFLLLKWTDLPSPKEKAVFSFYQKSLAERASLKVKGQGVWALANGGAWDTDFPEQPSHASPPKWMVGLNQAALDYGPRPDRHYPLEEVMQLAWSLGRYITKNEAGELGEDSGLVMSFSEKRRNYLFSPIYNDWVQSPGRTDMPGPRGDLIGYYDKENAQLRKLLPTDNEQLDGLTLPDALHHINESIPTYYGALYVKTTNPLRIGFQHGKAKLMIYYR